MCTSASGKIDLFVTHGGAGSAMESASHGVPTVVVPLFGDQMRNARMIERFGYGLVYNKMKLSNDNLLAEAVREGLYGTRCTFTCSPYNLFVGYAKKPSLPNEC